jgi:hypothetical protein
METSDRHFIQLLISDGRRPEMEALMGQCQQILVVAFFEFDTVRFVEGIAAVEITIDHPAYGCQNPN